LGARPTAASARANRIETGVVGDIDEMGMGVRLRDVSKLF
jgi:hypothetical protein